MRLPAVAMCLLLAFPAAGPAAGQAVDTASARRLNYGELGRSRLLPAYELLPLPGRTAARADWLALRREMLGKGDQWLALQVPGEGPATLRRSSRPEFSAPSGRETALRLGSPIGGPGRILMLRVALLRDSSATAWARMTEYEGADDGTYAIPLPAMARGDYQLVVEVFDPEVPEQAYSRAVGTLTVR